MHVAETEDSAALGGGGGGHMASEKAGACAAELDDAADVASALAWPPASQEAVVRSLGMVGMADRRPLRATSCQGQIGRALISSGEGSFCQERCFRCLRDRPRASPERRAQHDGRREFTGNTLEGMQRKSQVSCSAFSRHYACQRLFALISCYYEDEEIDRGTEVC